MDYLSVINPTKRLICSVLCPIFFMIMFDVLKLYSFTILHHIISIFKPGASCDFLEFLLKSLITQGCFYTGMLLFTLRLSHKIVLDIFLKSL